MRKNHIKKFYNYNEETDQFIIDIQLEDYRDAYSDWDFSPFVNRDLDDDLTEYLLDSSYDIPFQHSLLIRYHLLHQVPDAAREERTKIGMKNYFQYEMRKYRNRRARRIRDTIIFFILGCMMLLGAITLKNLNQHPIALEIITEGLFIGGWVMFWEMFSAWLFDLRKISYKIKHFKRLKEADLIFQYN